jgi:hypothetical protein
MTDKNKSTLNVNHVVLLFLVAVGGFFLWTEHKADLIGALPYLIFLSCPLMHIFMHKGHSGHNHKDDAHNTHQGSVS